MDQYSLNLSKLVSLNAPTEITDSVFAKYGHSDISLTAMKILIDFKPHMQWFFNSGILPSDALEYHHFDEEDLVGLHLSGVSLACSYIKMRTGKQQNKRSELDEKWRNGVADISLLNCDLLCLKETRTDGFTRNELVYDFSGSRIPNSEYIPNYTIARGCTGGFYCPDEGLYKVNFSGSNLRESSLYRGSMRDVILEGCDLTKCYFARASFENVNFKGAKLKKVNFRAVSFQGDINLEEAMVNKCNFYGASFENGYIIPSNSKNVDGKMLG